MNRTFLAIGLPFVVVGLFFGISGDATVGTTFAVLGVVFLVLGFATGRGDGDDGTATTTPDESRE